MRLQLLFSTADIVSWTSHWNGVWLKTHHSLVSMPHPDAVLPHCVCQEFNFQTCMRTHKLLTFSRPWFEFISKRAAISTTFPIPFYLTLVNQNWNVSFRLVEFSLWTDEKPDMASGQLHSPATDLQSKRHDGPFLGGLCGWDTGRAGKPLHTRYFQFLLMTSILDINPTPFLKLVPKDVSYMMIFVKAACSQSRFLHHFPLCPSLILLLISLPDLVSWNGLGWKGPKKSFSSTTCHGQGPLPRSQVAPSNLALEKRGNYRFFLQTPAFTVGSQPGWKPHRFAIFEPHSFFKGSKPRTWLEKSMWKENIRFFWAFKSNNKKITTI